MIQASGKYPLPQAAKAPVQAFWSPSAVEVNVCRSLRKIIYLQAERPGGKCLKLYMALRQQGFHIAPGLLIASMWPLFALSQEPAVMLPQIWQVLRGRLMQRDMGTAAEVSCRGDGVCVSLERLGPITPNGTVTGSVVLQGACGSSAAGFFPSEAHSLFSPPFPQLAGLPLNMPPTKQSSPSSL